MKKAFFTFFLLLAGITLHAQEYRDVVYLKNGSVIKGFYKEVNMDDTLRMETLDGSLLVCPVSDVVRIAKERRDVYVIHEQEVIKRVWRPRGYEGLIEYNEGISIKYSAITSSGVTTIHGYQVSPMLYAGAGVGLLKYTYEHDDYMIVAKRFSAPIFADVKFYPLKYRVSPYLECRGGYIAGAYNGPFVNGQLGVDFSLTPRFGILVSLGYQYQTYAYDANLKSDHAQFLTLNVGIRF